MGNVKRPHGEYWYEYEVPDLTDKETFNTELLRRHLQCITDLNWKADEDGVKIKDYKVEVIPYDKFFTYVTIEAIIDD